MLEAQGGKEPFLTVFQELQSKQDKSCFLEHLREQPISIITKAYRDTSNSISKEASRNTENYHDFIPTRVKGEI